MGQWGGARVGSGSKPNGEQPIRPNRRGRTPLVPVEGGKPAADESVSVIAPEDLPVDQRAFWQMNAPRALAQGTLTWRTEPAFRLLCEQEADRVATKKTIDKDGRTFIKVTVDGAGTEHQELKAHPLMSHYAKAGKSVEALMARFKIAPFGKAELQQKPKAAAVNPWSKVVAK